MPRKLRLPRLWISLFVLMPLSGCGKAPLLDVPAASSMSRLVGQRYSVVAPIEVYEIANPSGRQSSVAFAEIVTGQGYIDSLVRSRKQLPIGTMIEVRAVLLQIIPFEMSYVLLVSLSPPQTREDVEVRLTLSGYNTTNGRDLNSAYFKPLQ